MLIKKSVNLWQKNLYIMNKIISEKIVFDDKLIIEKGKISDGENTFEKLRINRPDASTVLIYNIESKKIILTRQFRYAIASKSKDPIYEIVAGKIDPDETPLDAAIRETEEEVGYKISPGNIKLLVSCFVSPGYTSERFYVYYATVINADKVSKGGGLKNENEEIEIIEMDRKDFYDLIKNGKIEDSKTYLAALLSDQD
jgi:nudix-type nucleoside diphosphatase (YffH/AdpP family)